MIKNVLTAASSRETATANSATTVTATVFQGDFASVAGGGESAVQRNVENDQEEPAVPLSAATQLCLHLSKTLTTRC